MMRHSRRHSRGMTMVELLVAMVISLFVIGGAISLLIASKRSYTESERYARMGENGRFALQILSMDLRHAGFFGEAAPPGIEADAGLDDVTEDCTGDAAVYDVENFLFVARADADGEAIGCIDDAVPDSDVVVIKSVRPRPLSDGERDDPGDDTGTIDTPESLGGTNTYVMANAINGVLFDGADTAPSIGIGGDVPLGNAWEYRYQAYYIRDGDVPQLSRKIIRWDGAGMAVVTEDVVDGIENLRVMIGTDSNDDGEVDRYRDSEDADIAWDRVESMEIHLLVRSLDRLPGQEDERTYNLGNEALEPGGPFQRTVVSGVVSVRNAMLLIRGNI